MKKQMNQFQRSMVVAIAILGVAAPLSADDPDKMPTGEVVMKKYVEATGGVEKLKGVKSIMMSGTLEFVGQGLSGKMESIKVAPNLAWESADLGAAGSQTRGTDGKVAWDLSVLGPRMLQGAEKDRMLDDASMEKMYNPMKFYKSVDVVEIVEIGKEQAYKVKTEGKDGYKSTDYFSVKTGLQLGSDADYPTAQGDISMQVRFVEHKAFDGIKMPTKVNINVMGGTRTVVFDKIEINGEVDMKKFEVPEVLKAMNESASEDG